MPAGRRKGNESNVKGLCLVCRRDCLLVFISCQVGFSISFIVIGFTLRNHMLILIVPRTWNSNMKTCYRHSGRSFFKLGLKYFGRVVQLTFNSYLKAQQIIFRIDGCVYAELHYCGQLSFKKNLYISDTSVTFCSQ